MVNSQGLDSSATPTRDEVVPTGWRYSINYGPDGEENFANVYAADGQFVGNLRTHHAIAICNAFAVCEKLASTPAPASGGVDAVLNLYREAVRIDVKMEGPQFMGANSSALKRAWEADRASLSPAATPVSEAGGEPDMWSPKLEAIRLLKAEDTRQLQILELLETIREQVRLGVKPEHRPDGLMKNLQTAVYGLRGRMPLLNDAAIMALLQALAKPASSPASGGVHAVREALLGYVLKPGQYEMASAFARGQNRVAVDMLGVLDEASLSPAATPVSGADMIPRAKNVGRYLAETNDGRLLYLNHATEWQEMPNIPAKPASSPAGVYVVQTLIDKTEKLIEAAEYGPYTPKPSPWWHPNLADAHSKNPPEAEHG